MLGLISPPMIRDHLLPKVDEFMSSHLSNWSDEVIDIQEKIKEIARIETGPVSDALKAEVFPLVLGTLSLLISRAIELQSMEKMDAPAPATTSSMVTSSLANKIFSLMDIENRTDSWLTTAVAISSRLPPF
ncbi:Cytochrome P450 85A1 [Platanthera guangdongensis]|uniref:Cytochrome P450 85A1 n=1 Tax=Platanthera guangdongensis TaxID=2320717 RepID=A0ABR2M6S6_9ASPA